MASKESFYQDRQKLSFIGALLVGGFLRLFQIGKDVFWFDEFNVLQVVSRTTLWEAIRLTHEHVMAMPLHYALVWLIGKISRTEGWMRLPEAIWGTLAILVGYLVARSYLTRRQAVISSWIVATSPLLIMYSQELRFYSGLVFFYLLTTLIGIQAIETNRVWNWVLFCIVCAFGLSFHVYVLLSLSIVYAYWLADLPKNRERNTLKGLIRSTIVLLIVFLGLLLTFGRAPKEPWTLKSDLGLLLIVLEGIGWAPPFPTNPLGWPYYLIVISFGVVGFLTWRDWYKPKKSLFLLLALLAQIFVIIFSNFSGKYFLAPRQMLFLVPFFGFYTAIGFDRIYQDLFKRLPISRSPLRQFALVLFLLPFSLLLIFALEQYYRLDKGIVKEALPLLQREWSEGDLICVFPDSDAVTYAYYWGKQFRASIFPCDDLDEEEKSGLRFILAPPHWTPPSNYKLFFRPSRPSLYERWIWERSQ